MRALAVTPPVCNLTVGVCQLFFDPEASATAVPHFVVIIVERL